jgi:hypothetical protein
VAPTGLGTVGVGGALGTDVVGLVTGELRGGELENNVCIEVYFEEIVWENEIIFGICANLISAMSLALIHNIIRG